MSDPQMRCVLNSLSSHRPEEKKSVGDGGRRGWRRGGSINEEKRRVHVFLSDYCSHVVRCCFCTYILALHISCTTHILLAYAIRIFLRKRTTLMNNFIHPFIEIAALVNVPSE